MHSFKFLLLLLSPIYCVKSINILIKTDSIVHTIENHYASYNLDYWYPNTMSQPPSWDKSSIFTLQFDNQNLKTLAKQISPSILRVGGFLDNLIVYDFPNAPVEKFMNYTFSCPGEFCLKPQRFDEIINFCKECGCQLVYGLNGLIGKNESDKSWKFENAFNLLAYVKSQKYFENHLLYGFELGNELDFLFESKDLIKDFEKLSQELIRLWPDSNNRPLLIGPDSYYVEQSFLQPFLVTPTFELNVLTYHHYDDNGSDTDPIHTMLKPEYHDNHILKARKAMSIITESDPKTLLWMGEGAAIARSGKEQYTDTFIASLNYLDNLGSLAQIGVAAHLRQTLVGGYYSLLSNNDEHTPHPDYYILYAWKQLVGNQVFSSISSPKTRVYSQCSKQHDGGVVLVVINLDEEIVTLTGSGLDLLSNRYEYKFTADNLTSPNVLLNGQLFQADKNGKLPELKTNSTNGVLTIPPYSANFIVYYEANNGLCRSPTEPTKLPIILIVVGVSTAVILGGIFMVVRFYLFKKYALPGTMLTPLVTTSDQQ